MCGSCRHRALAGEEQRVRHFAQQQPQRERRRRHERGTMEGASQRVREVGVGHRIGRRRIDRPGRRRRLNRPAHEVDPILTVNPRPVLAPRSDLSAGAEPERREHLRQGAAVLFENEPRADAGDSRRRACRPLRFGFPLHAHTREKI
jgi:hypothetical protein